MPTVLADCIGFRSAASHVSCCNQPEGTLSEPHNAHSLLNSGCCWTLVPVEKGVLQPAEHRLLWFCGLLYLACTVPPRAPEYRSAS